MRCKVLLVECGTVTKDSVVRGYAKQGLESVNPQLWLDLEFFDVNGIQVRAIVRAVVAVAIADAINILTEGYGK